MKARWSIAGLGVFILAGCGSAAGTKARTGGLHPSPATSAPEPARFDEPAQRWIAVAPLAREHRSNDAAGADTDERFAVARQVAALERSIELYQTFIDRAGDDPRYAEAVKRSTGRIEDAKLTICFLLDKPCRDSEKP